VGSWSWRSDIQSILKNYKEDDVVEIVADVYTASSWHHGLDGDEYDCESWLQDEKHRKLTPEQIAEFTEPEFPDEDADETGTR
jgi:hypothetical protein